MKILMPLLLIILFGVLGYGIYIFWDQYSAESVPFTHISKNEGNMQQEVIDYSQSQQFYPNMRYASERISYGFEPGCDSSKKESMLGALNIVSNLTVLEFYSSSSPEIIITCSELAPEPKNKDHFVAGEGGPTEIVNASQFSLIKQGKISLYREDKCSEPHIAVHELLHALGFDHNQNPSSILYPTLDCTQKVDQYFIDKIDQLYNVPSEADLVITNLEASKTGKYLDFSVEITNEGLLDATNVRMSLYGDGKMINDFDFGDVPVGTRKTLNVGNYTISKSTKTLKFIVDEKNKIKELNKDNNIEELVIEN